MFDAISVRDACIRWIRDFFAANGSECNAVVGISGGKDSSVVAALCVEGKEKSSEDFSTLFTERGNSGKPKICFLIGGSCGMSETVKARADLRLSMSKMTFPHHLARVMLIEQIYRAFKIAEGSRYHK